MAKYRYAAVFDLYSYETWNAKYVKKVIEEKKKLKPDCLYVFWKYGDSASLSGLKSTVDKCVNAKWTQGQPRTVYTLVSGSLVDVGILFLIGLSHEKAEELKEMLSGKGCHYSIQTARDLNDLHAKIEEMEKNDKKDQNDDIVDSSEGGSSRSKRDGARRHTPESNVRHGPSDQDKFRSGKPQDRGGPLGRKPVKPKAPEPAQPGHFDPVVQKQKEADVCTGTVTELLDDFDFSMDPIESAKEETATRVFARTMGDLVSKGYGELFFSDSFRKLAKLDPVSYRSKCQLLFTFIAQAETPDECYDQWKVAEPNATPVAKPDNEKMKALDAGYADMKKQVLYFIELCNTLYKDDPQG